MREEYTDLKSTGCGRFFEGNAAEMHEALNKRLAALPDDTVVYVSSIPSSLIFCPSRLLLCPMLSLMTDSKNFSGLIERSRVYQSQRQVRPLGAADRCGSEATVFCR